MDHMGPDLNSAIEYGLNGDICVESHYQANPGQSDYIGKMQNVLRAMLNELSDQELSKIKEKLDKQ